MTIDYPDQKKGVICRCSGTTTGQIRRLVDKCVNDLDSLSRATGACSGCGACDSDILALLAEYTSSVSHSAR
ncbi:MULTISPECIES: (2Fe-2S)-binding protein [unclassified Methylocaldum]|jgi:bacterioferritin-associated ferredoxin|uniref:(2Fe-2S)-binding protein n=1 Tax=unclassified Methylocaldum TaxID=2622260 RepID=UPI000A31F9E5|nr:(2Fe-2S)-binding protein [Methylocaldum sp. RMAD-M]MVF24549.1 (2Fe-2S)-binding protein [Methylocaldum sp. BRCS4]